MNFQKLSQKSNRKLCKYESRSGCGEEILGPWSKDRGYSHLILRFFSWSLYVYFNNLLFYFICILMTLNLFVVQYHDFSSLLTTTFIFLSFVLLFLLQMHIYKLEIIGNQTEMIKYTQSYHLETTSLQGLPSSLNCFVTCCYFSLTNIL